MHDRFFVRPFLLGSEAPRSVLPSMATTSPAVSLAIDETQATKPFFNASGSSAEKTRLKVSCDGMPLGRVRKLLNHTCLE